MQRGKESVTRPVIFFVDSRYISVISKCMLFQLLLLHRKAYLYGIRKLVVREYEKSFLANT